MNRYTYMVLLALTCSFAFPIRFGPCVKYSIIGSTQMSMRDCVEYSESTEMILFGESELFALGIGIEGRIADNLTVGFTVCMSNYDPVYIVSPDSSNFSINRTGRISMFSLGMRKSLHSFFVSAGVEAHYYRERWTDPYQGTGLSRDSLVFGPALGVGTIIDLDICALKPEMGIVFPGFSNLIGKIELTLLIP